MYRIFFTLGEEVMVDPGRPYIVTSDLWEYKNPAYPAGCSTIEKRKRNT
jgi:hypothetical protein